MSKHYTYLHLYMGSYSLWIAPGAQASFSEYYDMPGVYAEVIQAGIMKELRPWKIAKPLLSHVRVLSA